MLFLEVPPFDVIAGQDTPYIGFGEAIVARSGCPSNYLETVNDAKKRISEVFGIRCEAGLESIQQVEDTVVKMWLDGWNPKVANVNLFSTDFGCVVIEGLKQDLGGAMVFRSENDLTHVSLWWKDKSIEAFPFHAIYKRLTLNEGESLAFFATSIKSVVQGK